MQLVVLVMWSERESIQHRTDNAKGPIGPHTEHQKGKDVDGPIDKR